jgi:hypothetical protein
LSLPTIAPQTAVVELEGGHSVSVRGLSRGEALEMAAVGNALADGGTDGLAEGEIQLLAYGTDTPLDEVRQWYATAPSVAVKPILDKILEISGLGENGARPTSEG